ncbi:MAG TPA: hypothetical protein VFM05_13225 [Candidatus Saccharimonadales bacterium]|nr:hypothetical protein [Candidatus Saccharimonadales bacterium]
MAIEIGLLEQSIADVPREISGEATEIAADIALRTQIVVGLQYPDRGTLIAKGYKPVGDEYRGTKITLEAEEAERLAEAYMMAMSEKPHNASMECDSFVDFVMGWRKGPYHNPSDSFFFRRVAKRSPEPVELDRLRDGIAYEFIIPRLYFGEPGTVHVAIGTSTPTRNFSKFGKGALVTMLNEDSARYYARRGQLAVPQELASVSHVPRP